MTIRFPSNCGRAPYAAGMLLLSSCSAASGPAPVAPQCALPNVAAVVLSAAVPFEPPIADQGGIMGTVVVRVKLDAQSHVVSTAIVNSPSALLDASALNAASRSRYQTRIAACEPEASSLVVSFRFPGVALPPPGP